MTRVHVPSAGPADWQRLLADPKKHWRRGFSARTAAHCWEASDGFPAEIVRALRGAEEPALRRTELLLAIPEFQTPLPGGRRASQSDVFALGRGADGLVAMAVEAKVNEDFGPVFDEWYDRSSAGKVVRWKYIAEQLGIGDFIPRGVRYQLLHRLASAAIQARRFGARDAVLLVHSWATNRDLLADYQHFLEAWGRSARPGKLIALKNLGDIRLHAAWVEGNARFLKA